ncbi:hypothetical protein ASALC70_00605 [Alcanivorax sp. ALC70]|nr:hypothetical protein ASALC70_00605 [Alcanivorax sp. ALC70]
MIVPADDDRFQPNQQYTVVIDGLRLTNGDTARDRTLQFTTRALHEGPKELVVTDMDAFDVIRTFPNFDNQTVANGERLAAMDFSSFRFQMSQPVDAGTAVYGESVTLTYGADNEQVPATLLVDGRYLTVDPEPEHLDPSQNYTLTLTGDLASTYGANLTEERFRFRPLDTSPRGEPTELVQRLTVGGRSKLTGRDVNQVPVNGTLLGEDANITQARAESVIAELGDATQFPETLPIRLPKGTVLNGDEINPILIGGEVDAGFGSGDVTMTLLSDATGYLMQNPYSDGGESGARMIKLMMDVGIATGEARANGAFTQDLLHIELVGMANIDTDAGVLNVDAVSVVEPDILGQEFGYGLLSFQLQSYEDQNNAPRAAEDTTAPTLQSAMLGGYDDEMYSLTRDKAGLLKLSDPIVFNFSESIDPNSLENQVFLYQNGVEVPISVRVDGAALVIKPEQPLENSPASDPVGYQVEIMTGVSDLAGNKLQSQITENFELATIIEDFNVLNAGTPAPGVSLSPDQFREATASPMILAAYPGYPCMLDQSTLDITADIAGRCEGTYSDQQVDEIGSGEYLDLVPVSGLPANKPIVVQFSKPVDPDSVVLGQTFLVEAIDNSGAPLANGNVSGSLEVTTSSVVFKPDTPWEEDQAYRYVLVSNGDASSSACSTATSICGLIDGNPLKTEFMGELSVTEVNPPTQGSLYPPERDTKVDREFLIPNGGGKEFVQYFKGEEANNNVLQVLNTLPQVDENANLFHDVSTTLSTMPPSLYASGVYQYDNEEAMPADIPDPFTDPTADPGGILPPPNSVKILSEAKGGLPESPAPVVNGGVVGCGYQGFLPDTENPGQFTALPMECPEKKFSYLNGALTAEVTDEYVDGQGLKVLIWPAMFTGTSLDLVARLRSIPASVNAGSGPQYLRMRYADNGAGSRSEPIIGWIKDGSDGPELSTSVDIYVEAPYIPLFATPFPNPTHNFIGYPISLNLTGPISFMDDGRMVVDQYNIDPVDLELRLNLPDGSWGGSERLRIPERGNRIRYISEPIK